MSAAPHRPAGIISSLYKPETERNAVAARKNTMGHTQQASDFCQTSLYRIRQVKFKYYCKIL